jgi:hypothetical protein
MLCNVGPCCSGFLSPRPFSPQKPYPLAHFVCQFRCAIFWLSSVGL